MAWLVGLGLLRLRMWASLVVALCAFSGAAHAVPAFAVQTGQPCSGCHVGGFGPQLTPLGRSFKAGGYTLRAGGFNLPFSAMAVASYVHTQKDQPPPPPTGYSTNNNFSLDQVSLFLAGGAGDHLGAFVQATYDGVAKTFHWDNLDVRAVTTAKIRTTDLILGLTLNNAPSVQDIYNTVPAWRFPYTTSSLAPAPGTAPLTGRLAQNTLGLTAYTWINSEVYVEFGGYRSPGANFLRRAGIDPFNPGNIAGVAPYARVAYQKNYGDRNIQIGAFGMWANLYPGRDQSTGESDHYADTGVDASYQRFGRRKDVYTLNAIYTHEKQDLRASQALGLAQNRDNSLDDLRIDGSYYWHSKIGGTVGVFDTWGSADPLLYAGNRTLRPNSSGLSFQIDGTPFGDGNSPLGSRFNLRVGIQYLVFTRFDGAAHDYDGTGRSAAANNTLRVFSWVAY